VGAAGHPRQRGLPRLRGQNQQTAPLRADPDRYAQISARIPAGRWAADDDIAGAVAFLVSPDAAYVHGSVLVVDGGWLAR
jgi:2-deoxy-D-gluconate 3-dehydrogenase